MNPRLGLAFVVLSFTLIACHGGGDDEFGTGPVTEDQFNDGCRAECEWRAGCGREDDVADCTEDCVASFPDVGSWIRSDAYAALIACGEALECNANDDVCLEQCVPTAAHTAFEAQCREVLAPCGDATFLNQRCETSATPGGGEDAVFMCLVIPAIMDQMTACIPDGTTCEAGSDCIQAVLESRGIDL